MTRQEQMILDELRAAKKTGTPVKYWKLLYRVAKKYNTPGETLRDHFVQLVALCNKLINDKKIVRDRSRKQNNIAMTQYFFEVLEHYGKTEAIPDSIGGHNQEAFLHGPARRGGVGIQTASSLHYHK